MGAVPKHATQLPWDILAHEQAVFYTSWPDLSVTKAAGLRVTPPEKKQSFILRMSFTKIIS